MSDAVPSAAAIAVHRRPAVGDDQIVFDPIGLTMMGAFRLTLKEASPPASVAGRGPSPPTAVDDVRSVGSKAIAAVCASDETVMKLAPPNCGPLELRIAARSGGVSVTMICSSLETRTALLAMLPRLRDSLAVRGIPLLFGGVAARTEPSRTRDDNQLDDYA